MLANQAERAVNKTVLVSEASLLIGTEVEAAKDDFSPDLAAGVSRTCILSHTRLYAALSTQDCLSIHHRLAANKLHSSNNLQLNIAHSIIAWFYHSSHVNVCMGPGTGIEMPCSDIQQGPES